MASTVRNLTLDENCSYLSGSQPDEADDEFIDDLIIDFENFGIGDEFEELLITQAIADEIELCTAFETGDGECFNYLFLDPEMTENLPETVQKGLEQAAGDRTFRDMEEYAEFVWTHLDKALFQRFLDSIFYIGKESNRRPYEHFAETEQDRQSAKHDRIRSIWSKDKGVILLQSFRKAYSHAAYARESIMIEKKALKILPTR